MSALLSLLGLATRRDEEEMAALRRAWAGVYDVERGRDGYHAFCLLEVREPITASTPARLGAAIREAWTAAGDPAARPRRPRGGWYRQACDRADAVALRRKHPGYLIPDGAPGRWNAVHRHSGTVLGPVRTSRQLGRAIEADAWARPAVTVSGSRIAIRAAVR